MTLNRRIGLGFTLSVDPTGGTSWTVMGSIVDGWDEADAKADMADISILADTYKQKSKSQVDPGEITLEIAYDPDYGDTATMVAALKNLGNSPANWQISYPSGTQGAGSATHETFFGFVSGMGRTVKKDKLLTCKVTLTKTGAPGFYGN